VNDRDAPVRRRRGGLVAQYVAERTGTFRPQRLRDQYQPRPAGHRRNRGRSRGRFLRSSASIVDEGFDPIIDRVVAIKTIKNDELDHEEADERSRRFLIEARAAGRLNDKNTVGIYDYGEEKGLSFIVMEFVQGKELKSFFAARHPFSMSQIARLMGELLDALGYSHRRGVIHRDVKRITSSSPTTAT